MLQLFMELLDEKTLEVILGRDYAAILVLSVQMKGDLAEVGSWVEVAKADKTESSVSLIYIRRGDGFKFALAGDPSQIRVIVDNADKQIPTPFVQTLPETKTTR